MHFDLLARIGGDPVMTGLLSERVVVDSWLEVEAGLARALAKAEIIDADTGERIAAACVPETIDLDRLWAEAGNVGYPILPLVTMIAEQLHDQDASYVHYGATTQDIMDSGLVLQTRRAVEHLRELVQDLGDALAVLVEAHRETVMPARTHAMQAVPTTFGAKLAVFVDTLARQRERLALAQQQLAVVSLFGAGGTSAALADHATVVRQALAVELGLQDCGVSWHVARDRLLDVAQASAAIAATCVRLGREVIDLGRLEIAEVGEVDGKLRGASSTMPQKSNPISSEMTVGFGTWAAATASAMSRAMEAGHERSAGEWQTEWAALPATLAATAGALTNAVELARGLRVFPDRMRENLEVDGGRLMAEAYMIALAPHLGRTAAHDLVYEAVRHSRQEDLQIREAVRQTVAPDVWRVVEPVLPWPQGYLGNASSSCEEALRLWRGGGHAAHVAGDIDAQPLAPNPHPPMEPAAADSAEPEESHP